MINPNFNYLKDINKIQEANKLNEEFKRVYMNCDDWSYEECVIHILEQFPPKYLTKEEYTTIIDNL